LCQRSLQLSVPRRVSKYRELLHDQLKYHKVLDKCSALLQAAQENKWPPELTISYARLDTLITESMLYAERSCSKKYSKRFKWSPTQIQAVETVRFWCLLLKRSKGLPISHPTIQHSRIKAGIPDSLDPLDLPTVVFNLRLALSTLHSSQKSHIELREQYLHCLAGAIVLERHPHLKKDANMSSLHILMEEQVERLLKREHH
jgi:hypothetical protein